MEENINNQPQSLSLAQAWLLYAAAWIGLVAIWFVLASVEWLLGSNSPWLFLALLLGYLGVGVMLNLKVLRKLVEWHPMYSTIGNCRRSNHACSCSAKTGSDHSFP